MAYEAGELRTMQSGKEIDLNTTVPIMIDILNSLRQVNTGIISGSEDKPTDNERRLNQVKGLTKLISNIETLITFGEGDVDLRNYAKWYRKNKELPEEEKEPYDETGFNPEDMKYDINKLKFWNNFLSRCRKEIIFADKTKTIKDDFMITRIDSNGEKINELTDNFFEMRNDLRNCFSEVKKIMMVNKVIAAGITEDEELTYKEQEQLFIERMRDS